MAMSKLGRHRLISRGTEARLKLALKWALYVLLSLTLFVLQTTKGFWAFTPVLLIPLAIAVSMFEHDLKLVCAIFGGWCGLLCDIASDRLFGFDAILLTILCVAASLLITHLARPYLLNMAWMTLVSVSFVMLVDYFFYYMIWDVDGILIVFYSYTIPVIVSTTLLCPVLFWLVRKLYTALQPERDIIPEGTEEAD